MPQRKIIISIVLIFLFLIGSFVYFILRIKIKEEPPQIPSEEKTMEEILQSLTVPAGEKSEVSEKIIKSLTAPGKGKVSEDILQQLTAPE